MYFSILRYSRVLIRVRLLHMGSLVYYVFVILLRDAFRRWLIFYEVSTCEVGVPDFQSVYYYFCFLEVLDIVARDLCFVLLSLHFMETCFH